MRIVCEHMAQDRLKHPFWIGKYFIKPVSKILEDEENGSIEIYKVIISQPVEKKTENEKVTQKEAELEKHVKKSEVKGLPFLSKCCPAGLLKAEKKSPDAPGQIMVCMELSDKSIWKYLEIDNSYVSMCILEYCMKMLDGNLSLTK